jgi:hypothetical protein
MEVGRERTAVLETQWTQWSEDLVYRKVVTQVEKLSHELSYRHTTSDRPRKARSIRSVGANESIRGLDTAGNSEGLVVAATSLLACMPVTDAA